MAESKIVFSANSLQDYLDCQRRFELKYILKLTWPAQISKPFLQFEQYRKRGTLFHQSVEQFFRNVPPATIQENIHDPELIQWWQNFLSFFEHQKFQFAQPELTLRSAINEHSLIAKIDLLTVNSENKLVIFDWKTTSSLKKPKRSFFTERMQTRMYPFVVSRSKLSIQHRSEIAHEDIELVYWFPQFPQDPIHLSYSKERYEKDEELLSGLIKEISEKSPGEFPLTESQEKCKFCVYRSYCGRGEKAGNLFEEETEEGFDLSEIDFDLDSIEEIAF